jgi:hypothetical protein
MISKAWLFQAAMDAGHLQTATAGFRGIRQKTRASTRIHLEATALLAICLLRAADYDAAEPLMAEVLKNDGHIKSASRRRQFRLRMIERFEEETLLFALGGDGQSELDVAQIQDAAGRALQTKTEDEILADLGAAIPPTAIAALLRVHEFARKQLPSGERLALPPAQSLVKKATLGKRIAGAAQRVVWRAICDPNSDIYKLWYSKGMAVAIDGRFFTAAIVAALNGFRVGSYAIAVAVTAILLKAGLEVFCETWTPKGAMIARTDKR